MIKNLFSSLKQLIYISFKNIDEQFLCLFPRKLGGITSFFLNHIFSGIQIEQEQVNIVKKIPKNAIIVFTTKYKNNFEFLFANVCHKHIGLPTPQIAFDYSIYILQPISRLLKVLAFQIKYMLLNHKISNPYETQYYNKKLNLFGCAFLSLIEKKGFYLRFVKKRKDPISYLIEIQKKNKRPIYIVPQLMFFDRKPLPAEPGLMDMIFGNSQKPGKIRKIVTLLRSPSKIFVEFAQPLNLQNWINKSKHQAKQLQHQVVSLRRELLLQLNHHHQIITGPTLKSQEEVKEAILTNQKMQIFMKEYSNSKHIPLRKTIKKANTYVNEIAAKYNPSLIKIMSYLIHWITNSTFDGAVIDKKGLSKVKQMSKQGPLILLPCHKSHVDYLVLPYVLYNHNMPCPHVAAGKNLSFWPLGPIFRGGGAFFIRRSFKGQKLYSKVFSEYISKLLEEGFNIEIFIEGGRSRTGKLLTPKLGLISILLEAFKNGVCNDMILVPVYIGYDRIIEEHAYIHEIEGGNKNPESFWQVIKARRFLKKRYGKIYINFHDPISVKNFFSKTKRKSNKVSKKEHMDTCYNIARNIITAIDKETVITPHGLTAAAILNLQQQRFTNKDIITIANTYLFFAISQKAKITDTLIMSPDNALKNAFKEYKQRKLIEEISNNNQNSLEVMYFVKNNKRSLLEFYKNNCISYFVHGSTVALAILGKDAFQFCASDLHEQHRNLIKFFKYEFAVDLEKPSELFVRKTIKAFIDDAMLMPHKTIPDTYNITSLGYQKLKLYAIFLKPYFEAYLVVLHFFKQNKSNLINKNSKDIIKKIQSMGVTMYKRNDIDTIESISKNNYSNGVKLFYELKLKIQDNKIDDINKHISKINKQLKLINK